MFLGEEFVDKALVKTIKNKVLAKKTELEKSLGHADIEVPKSLLNEEELDQVDNLHEQLLEQEVDKWNRPYKSSDGWSYNDKISKNIDYSYFPQVKLWKAKVPRNKKSTVKTRHAYFFTKEGALKHSVFTHWCNAEPIFTTFK